jgi:hypothetical protein
MKKNTLSLTAIVITLATIFIACGREDSVVGVTLSTPYTKLSIGDTLLMTATVHSHIAFSFCRQ